MKILRRLQNAAWEFDTEKNELTVIRSGIDQTVPWSRSVVLNKVQMYSLSRFLIRSFQKMSQKQKKGLNANS